MSKSKAIIQFCGTNYFGWQIQPGDTPTVQGEFNKALRRIYKQEVKSVGSGRTDSGVHAREFHVAFTAPINIPNNALIKAMNANLPSDIRVLDISPVDDDFRPTNDAKSKEYRYYFTTENFDLPFSEHLMTTMKYDLDVDLMKKACALFVGVHDFKNFHCLGSEPSSTTREVYSCEIIKNSSIEGPFIPDYFCIKISGNGFLKQMVRLIVGAIWDVGRGRISLSDITMALSKESEFCHIAPVAPAKGLYKYKVHY